MENVLAVRDEYRMQNWAGIIRERQESGLTVKKTIARSTGSRKRHIIIGLESCARLLMRFMRLVVWYP